MRIGLLLAALLIVSACVPSVRSDVEVFHSLGHDYAGRTVAVVAGDDDKAATLEFTEYARRLSRELRRVGFTVVPEDSPHDYEVVLDYGIDAGERVTRVYSVPGYGFPYYRRSLFHGYYPYFGHPGYRTRTRSYLVYTRDLSVEIWEPQADGGASREQVYSAAVRSRGTCGRLSSVIDEMLMAAFDGFPGETGSTRTIETERAAGRC